MPQMAPISWLSLFIMFTLIFMFFNMINYFSIFYTSPQSKKINSINNFSMNWKW